MRGDGARSLLSVQQRQMRVLLSPAEVNLRAPGHGDRKNGLPAHRTRARGQRDDYGILWCYAVVDLTLMRMVYEEGKFTAAAAAAAMTTVRYQIDTNERSVGCPTQTTQTRTTPGKLECRGAKNDDQKQTQLPKATSRFLASDNDPFLSTDIAEYPTS